MEEIDLAIKVDCLGVSANHDIAEERDPHLWLAASCSHGEEGMEGECTIER